MIPICKMRNMAKLKIKILTSFPLKELIQTWARTYDLIRC